MRIDAYPLTWPPGWPRTEPSRREHSRFSAGRSASDWHKRGCAMTYACEHLEEQMRLLGAEDHIISSNVKVRLDGRPYARQRTPEDPGAAVYFRHGGADLAMAADKYLRVADNLYAIAKSVEAIRGLERWGTKRLVNAAFRGFRALPPAGRPWYDVLGLGPDASREEVKRAFKRLSLAAHPDRGGDREAWEELRAARDAGLEAAR